MHVCLGGITDGVNAELICADSGILLGIRVSWSWVSSVPAECYQSPVVELTYITKRTRNTVCSNPRRVLIYMFITNAHAHMCLRHACGQRTYVRASRVSRPDRV